MKIKKCVNFTLVGNLLGLAIRAISLKRVVARSAFKLEFSELQVIFSSIV